jgi:uncharacterized protein YodC (DUF2158 family)
LRKSMTGRMRMVGRAAITCGTCCSVPLLFQIPLALARWRIPGGPTFPPAPLPDQLKRARQWRSLLHQMSRRLPRLPRQASPALHTGSGRGRTRMLQRCSAKPPQRTRNAWSKIRLGQRQLHPPWMHCGGSEMSNFPDGNVVKLKSGGPKMTIIWVVEGKFARLCWHDVLGFHMLNKDDNMLPLHVLEHA